MKEKAKVRRVDLYADEWLAGTSKLGPNEGWVYVQICMLIYSHNGPIRCMKPVVSRMVQPSDFSRAAALLVMSRPFLSGSCDLISSGPDVV